MLARIVPCAALIAFAVTQFGCAPVMVDRAGRDVFNPVYRGFLDTAGRDAWQQPARVVETLALRPGLVVADIGAGTGYFTWRFAERVGPSGRVYATDVQEEMLADLRRLVEERHLRNVEVVPAGFDDPALPAGCCDLVFLANVYKEIDDRARYMRKVARALRPAGRLAIIGFAPDASGLGPPRNVRLPAAQVTEELARAGFAVTERHDFLPRQYFLVAAPGVTGTGRSSREAPPGSPRR